MTAHLQVDKSPFQRLLGLELVRAEDGVVEMRLPWRDELGRADDSDWYHGGVISASSTSPATTPSPRDRARRANNRFRVSTSAHPAAAAAPWPARSRSAAPWVADVGSRTPTARWSRSAAALACGTADILKNIP
jgi:hypothetical protein